MNAFSGERSSIKYTNRAYHSVKKSSKAIMCYLSGKGVSPGVDDESKSEMLVTALVNSADLTALVLSQWRTVGQRRPKFRPFSHSFQH